MDKEIKDIAQNVLYATINDRLKWIPSRIDKNYYCDVSGIRLNVSRTGYFRYDKFLFEICYDSTCIAEWGEFCQNANPLLRDLYDAVVIRSKPRLSNIVEYDEFYIFKVLSLELDRIIKGE